MELLVLLLALGVFALWVSNRNLKTRLDWLEQRLDDGSLTPPPAPADEPKAAFTVGYTPPPRVEERVQAAPPAPPEPQAIPFEPAAAPEERETLGALFERLVAGKLLIWLGGIALVVAAVYLIRYSIELGLVTPQLRMAGAALFGLALLAAGEAARWKMADDPRIAQALVGAGIAVLYATAYGTHILYGLIDAGIASAAMLAITGAALGLSLRHGAPTAVMGLAGGFLTPALVGDPDAGPVPLLAYLGLLDLAIFLIAWRRGWTWLAAAAVALSFVWSAFLLSQSAEDALASGVFIILLAVAASLVRPGGGRALGLIQPLLIGIVQLAILAARTDLGFLGWVLFGILAAASMALAVLRSEYRLAPAAALVLGLLVLLGKAGLGQDPFLLRAMGGLILLFGGGGLALALWKGGRLWTAIACGGFAGPLFVVRAAWPGLLEPIQWGGLAAVLAIGPAALIWRNRARASAEAPAELALLAAGTGTVILLGAAIWDLAPSDLIAAGWLVVALAVALAARRFGDLALGTVAALAAAIGIGRAVATVPELSTTALASLLGFPALAVDLPGARAALFALALPAGLLGAMRWALPPLPLGARRALVPAAGVLAAGAAYAWFKQAFGLAPDPDFAARGFLERTLLTQALFALGWLCGSAHIPERWADPDLMRKAGAALTGLAAARLVWFDMLVHNPAWWVQWVGPLPVLNLILPAFLLSAVWLYAARRRAHVAGGSGIWLVLFLAALIAGALLMVRQAFQGAFLDGASLPIAEFYGYSLAGLVLSIGLLVAGIRLPDKALRLAGLVLLTATMLKVFLIDASELEGVLRILSFLGLGIVLIGIGRLYGPVLRAERGGV
ncbi:DUF2339 domain-containing protein [Sphingosinicella sp. LHD-64]|uniref:DUF2339 domain-containing protein n=1 Tax=Sphingosinicella sp. LHD-64 TaxID=3072139 RepID=UPI00280F4C65|nr:DUF2339 domain-containing protein [Sphingosinicella sp. LHD-64]MDQ8755952.1 DUF2339 domain-containing protein [Sphingosinicella sp. LHD-64]